MCIKNVLEWIKKHHIFWFLILAIIIILTRGLTFDRFVTTDEMPWLMRSANFYYALGQKDFAQTYQESDPAVTLMINNTAAFLIDAPQYRGMGEGYFTEYPDFYNYLDRKNIDAHQILITARAMMLVENLILLLIAFGITIRLIGIVPAFSAFLLIALDPFHIALTMIAQKDGLLSCLMLLSVISFLAYFFEKRRIVYIVISAGTGSLACLTKLPGYLLFALFFTLLVIAIVRDLKSGITKDKKRYKSWINPLLRDIVIFFVTFILIYVVLWPAMWVNPIGTIASQINAPFHFLNFDDSVAKAAPVVIEETANSTASGFLADAFYYPDRYLWLSTPVELIGLAVALVMFILRTGFFKLPSNRKFVAILTGFSLFIVVSLTIVPFRGSRYMEPAMVLMDMIGAFGWLGLLQFLRDSKFQWVRRPIFYLLLASLLAVQIGGNIAVHPYYYSYYNLLMGGGKKAGETRFVGSGEGLDEAGRYLSQKPNAENMTVMSWYGIGCFSFYFPGKTVMMGYDKLSNVDYLVVYTNQWYRRTPTALFDILDQVEPEHTVWINGIEYARIYKVSDLPVAAFDIY